MIEWNEALVEENIDRFFLAFAPMAYTASYKRLRDSTRTENAVVESMLEVYQRRRNLEPHQLLYAFGKILEKRVGALQEKYPIGETDSTSGRKLDEFTQNMMLEQIHKRMSSPTFRAVDALSTGGHISSDFNRSSFLGWLKQRGINPLLLVQLCVALFLIFLIALLSMRVVFDIQDDVPAAPQRVSIPMEARIVQILPYLPLKSSQGAPTETIPPPTQATSDVDTDGTTDVTDETETSADADP